MLTKDIGKARKYSDRFLKSAGLDRDYVWNFWVKQTPEGRHAKKNGDTRLPGALAFVKAVIDCQDFVYSDAGDRILGLPERAATDEEKDGLLGPGTWRRMEAWRDHVRPTLDPVVAGSDYVIFAGERVPVRDVSVVSFDEPGGLNLPLAHRDRYGVRKGRQKGFRKWPKPITKLIGKSRRYGTMLFFGHWDVCSSSAKCFRVLLAVKLGSSFGIDGDGTVWWWSDPGLMYGYHGGEANTHAVLSADLQNPYHLKYAAGQERRWGLERPVLRIDSRDRFGRGRGFLGMYRAQLVSMLRILKTMSRHLGMPFTWPTDETGRPLPRNIPDLFGGDHHGCATHRHLPETTKIDIRALEYQLVVLLMTEEELAAEFPEMVECFRIHDPWAQEMLGTFESTCRWPELGLGATQ